MRQARDKYPFPKERHQSVYLQAILRQFLEQHGDDFLVCGLTSNVEMLADEFKNHFLVKKAEIVSLKPEHQNETHFLKRRISVDDFGWHVELDQTVCEKFVGCNGDESLQIDGHSWIEGTGGQPR